MAPERKTTLVSIYKDAHSALKLVSALTGESMTKLIDDVLIEQFRSMIGEDSKLSEVAKNFLSGRLDPAAGKEAPAEEAITET